MDKTNINALGQSIERSLHLIDKNLFSVKQYQFPPKIGLNLFRESHRTLPLCVRWRLRLYICPIRPEVMAGCDREWRAYRQVCVQWGWNCLDYGHGNMTYQMFSLAAAGVMNTVSVFWWLSGKGEEKMDPDKSVVFGYDRVPARLDLAIPAPYVHNLCFPTRHSWKGFKLSESDTEGRHLESGNLKMCIRNERVKPQQSH